MKDYSQLAARVAEESPAFEAFYAAAQRRMPALQGGGALTLPPAGFKRALKTAYLAGEHDTVARLMSEGEAPQADAPDPDHEISTTDDTDEHG